MKVIESRRDNDDNVNEISIVLPSDDDLWVALCALTPVPTTNRPFLNRQQTQTQHIRVRERAQLRHQHHVNRKTLILVTDCIFRPHVWENSERLAERLAVIHNAPPPVCLCVCVCVSGGEEGSGFEHVDTYKGQRDDSW